MTDKELMQEAIRLAIESASDMEVPVGAVVALDGQIVSVGKNRRETGKNALYHAEIEAINNACKILGGWRLHKCQLFVTLEPCPMCAGAIINSRLKKVTFGAFDKKAGSMGSVVNLVDLPYNHKPEIVSGFMESECSKILSDFFGDLRKRKKDNRETTY